MAHSLKIAAGVALAGVTITGGVVAGHREGFVCQGTPQPATVTAPAPEVAPKGFSIVEVVVEPEPEPRAARATARTPEPVLSMTVEGLFRRYEVDPKGAEHALRGRLVRLSGEPIMTASGMNLSMVARRDEEHGSGVVICERNADLAVADGRGWRERGIRCVSMDGKRWIVYGRLKPYVPESGHLFFPTHGPQSVGPIVGLEVANDPDVFPGAPTR